MEQLHIRIPKETHKSLKLYAVSSEKSINALVGDFIERCLKEIKKEVA
ncbi:MAG: toxin-antitoxin system HicB family antitoxin [Clostridia bacterium]|jgi:predicted HicB family RNase H-like nuclease|nr:toxin-antitoxin system HicB family antitoxin [Clostridia bacterium]